MAETRLGVGEQPVDEQGAPLPLYLRREVSRLLLELALDRVAHLGRRGVWGVDWATGTGCRLRGSREGGVRSAHQLAIVDHPARQCPVARVLALDGDHL